VVRNSADVELTGFTGSAAPGTGLPAVVMEDVDGALVRGCRARGGPFLRLGGRSRAIRVLGNDFTATDTPVGLADEGLRSELALEGNLVRR
jgi:hypothetical protein